MKKILLPTDFSKNSWNAIKYAIHFFENETCDFYILHVHKLSNIVAIDYSYANEDDVITEDVHTKPAMQQLRKVLRQIKTQFPANINHRFYPLYDYNFFVESIRKHVEEKKIGT